VIVALCVEHLAMEPTFLFAMTAISSLW